MINTWRQAGLSRGFVDYSENREKTDHRQTHYRDYRVPPAYKKRGHENSSSFKSKLHFNHIHFTLLRMCERPVSHLLICGERIE